jgi:16S rRNA U516 pseudouridylate synthase RsuA-like enzyme
MERTYCVQLEAMRNDATLSDLREGTQRNAAITSLARTQSARA